jgi:hypothetical protein
MQNAGDFFYRQNRRAGSQSSAVNSSTQSSAVSSAAAGAGAQGAKRAGPQARGAAPNRLFGQNPAKERMRKASDTTPSSDGGGPKRGGEQRPRREPRSLELADGFLESEGGLESQGESSTTSREPVSGGTTQTSRATSRDSGGFQTTTSGSSAPFRRKLDSDRRTSIKPHEARRAERVIGDGAVGCDGFFVWNREIEFFCVALFTFESDQSKPTQRQNSVSDFQTAAKRF